MTKKAPSPKEPLKKVKSKTPAPPSEDTPAKEGNEENGKPLKKVKPIKIIRTTSIVSKTNGESKSPKKDVSDIHNELQPPSTSEITIRQTLSGAKSKSENDKDNQYDKVNLKRAITENLIPIKIAPLEIVLSKEPSFSKDETNRINLNIRVESSILSAWEFWTTPKHIKKWYRVSDDWKVSEVKNDFKVGGKFHYSMESQSGEVSEFAGVYTEIIPKTMFTFTTDEHQKVSVSMAETMPELTEIRVDFEPDDINPVATQRKAWGILLENFKAYVLKVNPL